MHSSNRSENAKSENPKNEKSVSDDYFALGVRYVLQNEIGNDTNGGYTHNPKDSGGATKWGISTATLSAWRGVHVSPETMKALTREEAELIYREVFWKPLQCPKIKRAAIAVALFDAGVLYGSDSAVECAQKAAIEVGCGSLKADGYIGPATIGALNAVRVESWIGAFTEQLKERAEYLADLYPKNEEFENGWKKRADRLKIFS